MSKTALLFAGQGAQSVGMGKDFARQLPEAKAWFDRANAGIREWMGLAAYWLTGRIDLILPGPA